MVHSTLSITAQDQRVLLNLILEKKISAISYSITIICLKTKDISAARFGTSDDLSTFTISD